MADGPDKLPMPYPKGYYGTYWRGAFRRSRDADRDRAWTDRLAFLDQMEAGGYVEWASVPPPRTDDPVECRRFEWPHTEFIRPAQTHPAMNVAGLYWRSHGPTIEAQRATTLTIT